MSKNKIEIRITKREKTEIKNEIDKIYDSKLKYNVVGRKIRMKTQFLSQDNTIIDSISLHIKGF